VVNENHLVGRFADDADDVSLSGGEDLDAGDVRWLHLYCARPNKWPTPTNVGDDGDAGADECGPDGSTTTFEDGGGTLEFVRPVGNDVPSPPLMLSRR
jgi:hypothetical protein